MTLQRNGSLWEQPRTTSGFDQSRKQCRNRFNWSDGGYWIGSGPEPDCSMRQEKEQRSIVTVAWDTEQQVLGSRDAVNRSRNRLGYLVGGLVTVVSGGTSKIVQIIAGVGAASITNNLPSIIDDVRIGDTLTITMTVVASRGAHPWADDHITFESDWLLRGKSTKQLSFGFFDVPLPGPAKFHVSHSQRYSRGGVGYGSLPAALFDRLFDSL